MGLININTMVQSTSQQLLRSVEDREAKIFENLEKAKDEHANKLGQSNSHFRNTRVTSCSGVLMKNGKAVCLAFKGQAPKPVDISKQKSAETTSVSHDTFKTRLIPHAGMTEKKLEAYHPNAKRNLLAQPTVVMPYKNSSQIVIGDRSSYYSRQFVSTNANCF